MYWPLADINAATLYPVPKLPNNGVLSGYLGAGGTTHFVHALPVPVQITAPWPPKVRNIRVPSLFIAMP